MIFNKEEIASAKSDYALFVGKNYAYYSEAWLKLINDDGTWRRKFGLPRFNWAAGLLGFLWLLYRKMYLYALIYWVIAILTTLFFERFAISGIGMVIGFGMGGNGLYLYHVKRHIEKIKKESADNDSIKQNLVKTGGVLHPAKVILATIMIIAITATAEFYFEKAPSIPDCDDKEVQKTLRTVVKQIIDNSISELNKWSSSYTGKINIDIEAISNIEESGYDELKNIRVCNAALLSKVTTRISAERTETRVTYTIRWKDDKKTEFWIEASIK